MRSLYAEYELDTWLPPREEIIVFSFDLQATCMGKNFCYKKFNSRIGSRLTSYLCFTWHRSMNSAIWIHCAEYEQKLDLQQLKQFVYIICAENGQETFCNYKW